MTIWGYHASHEQHSPADLLGYARLAEQAGFATAMCSDHFHPWTEAQGESGFAWAWLGAALQATDLSFGTVTAPGWRYHPAIAAQAFATLAVMFPERVWVAVGSGEALNGHITGAPWPTKAERNARLLECVDVMRALWCGETVTHHGRVTVEDARLYSLPTRAPQIFAAALSPETARWAGSWADGLITIPAPHDKLRGIMDAFREGGGAGKPLKLQASLSWAETEAEARAGAHRQWASVIFDSEVLATLRTPAQFAAAAAYVTEADVASKVRVSSDLGRHTAWLAEYAELGFDDVYLFNVNTNQPAFIEAFGEHVLPRL